MGVGRNTAMSSGWLLRATLLGLAAIAIIPGSDAAARVGVTSGADGDPLGKPPNETERILRIGIDVQANELITTNANDRAHLVFLDGSALTVGPNARLTIDKFVYDPNTQRGELAVNAGKGVLRLVGGKISKNTPITITTPASTIGIRGGITIISVTQVETIANFVFGNSMTVTAGGATQTATRAGTQVVTTSGAAPGAPTLLKPGALTAALSSLEGASPSTNNSADQSAQTSGFSSKNSGQPAPTPNTNLNVPPNPNNNTLTNAVSNNNPANQPLGNSTLQNPPTTTTITTTTPPPSSSPSQQSARRSDNHAEQSARADAHQPDPDRLLQRSERDHPTRGRRRTARLVELRADLEAGRRLDHDERNHQPSDRDDHRPRLRWFPPFPSRLDRDLPARRSQASPTIRTTSWAQTRRILPPCKGDTIRDR